VRRAVVAFHATTARFLYDAAMDDETPDPEVVEQCTASIPAGRCILPLGHDTDAVTEVRDIDGNATGEMRVYGSRHRILIEWS